MTGENDERPAISGETTGHPIGLTEGIRTPDIRDHNAAL